MSDIPTETPPQATEPEVTAAPETAHTPVQNGTPAEDIEMVGVEPVAPSAQEQASAPAATTEAAPPSESQAQAQPPQAQQQPPQQSASAPASAPSPAPAPTSARNSPHPSGHTQIPVHATLHGAPARQYLNAHVTPHLLEGMKHLVTAEYASRIVYETSAIANTVAGQRSHWSS